MNAAEAHELEFRAMSSDAHVVVVGPGAADGAEWARHRVAELEARWTRFAPSELTALNEQAGRVVEVSAELYGLVEASLTAWTETEGRFDPTVLVALEAAGYDRSFDELAADQPEQEPAPAQEPAPGMGGVLVWPESRQVLLPIGVAIDPGGIGKGLAADLVVEQLLSRGAQGALVNLGGDTRVAGQGPQGEWVVSIDHPLLPGAELARLGLADGAVVTSSRLRRTWRRGGRVMHHLIDPRTGRPVETDVAAVSVVAGRGWWAEATSKSVFVAGSRPGLDSLRAASAIVVTVGGDVLATEDLVATLRV